LHFSDQQPDAWLNYNSPGGTMRLTVRVLVNQLMRSDTFMNDDANWKWTQAYAVQLITFTLQFRERSEMVH